MPQTHGREPQRRPDVGCCGSHRPLLKREGDSDGERQERSAQERQEAQEKQGRQGREESRPLSGGARTVIARNCPFEETCARLFVAFFKKYSNDHLRKRPAVALLAVLKRKRAFPGKSAAGSCLSLAAAD